MQKKLFIVKAEVQGTAFYHPIYMIVASTSLEDAIHRAWKSELCKGRTITHASAEFFQIHFQEGWKSLMNVRLFEVRFDKPIFDTERHWWVADSTVSAVTEAKDLAELNPGTNVLSVTYLGTYEELENSVEEVSNDEQSFWSGQSGPFEL